MAAYTKQLESQLEMQERAIADSNQMILNMRFAKSRLKDSVRQKDVEIQQLQKELGGKGAEIQQIRAENLRFKRVISESNETNKQIPDTSIQRNMEAIFCCVRDWALDVIRKEQLGKFNQQRRPHLDHDS
jgi:uncharacterized protein YdcH (DUF465 family)